MTAAIDHGALRYDDKRRCACCGQPPISQAPTLYRVTVENLIVDRRAVATLAGTAQIVRALGIAAALSDPNIARPMVAGQVLVCFDCATAPEHDTTQLIDSALSQSADKP